MAYAKSRADTPEQDETAGAAPIIQTDEELRRNLVARMKRIEGQARGVQRMIEEQRSCEEITIQLAAMKAAIVQVGMTVLASHLADCIEDEKLKGHDTGEALNKFMTVFSKFS